MRGLVTQRWNRVEALFETALQAPEAERAQFLKDACGDDRDLLNEVASLLAHDSQASPDFLAPTGSGDAVAAADAGPDSLVGQTVGHYRVLRLLGHGGMGSVYLAEQDRPKRLVALKLMAHMALSPAARRRFELEYEVLGHLSHPHVAQVYEVGMFSQPGGSAFPTPFFAMEYVRGGLPLTDYARRHQLDLAERLRLFCQVCEAIHHGHQKGIIHRDLKPANILVSDEEGEQPVASAPCDRRGMPTTPPPGPDPYNSAPGEGGACEHMRPVGIMRRPWGADATYVGLSTSVVKVIDFGVAKCTNNDLATTTLHTMAGQLVGTVAYMSPEQCDGDPLAIDIRSDVYSLGVVLFELLCGQPPYPTQNLPVYEALRAIREQPPTPPRSLNRQIGRDLEQVMLKALAKKPEQRYASVEALLCDLRNALVGEPVSARPPGIGARLLRWGHRHPIATTAILCGVVATLVICGTAAGIWLLAMKPHRVVLTKDASEARLVTSADRVLHAWPIDASEESDQVAFGEIVRRPSALGGGLLAIVGYASAAECEYAGQLCAYDIEKDLNRPAWTGEISDADLPSVLKHQGFVAREFAARYLWVLDVFDETAGPELVVVFGQDGRSRIVVRIYDLGGTMRYQLVQDGGINSCYWMSGPKLLIFGGTDERGKDHMMAVHPEYVVPHVFMLFAMRPRFDGVLDGYVEPTAQDPDLRPVWYRYVHPAQHGGCEFNIRIARPPRQYPPDRSVFLHFEGGRNEEMRRRFGMFFAVSEEGQEIPGSRMSSDAYRGDQTSNDPSWPPPETFQLSDTMPTG